MERLALHIESLIFSAESTISLNQIKTCIEETLEQSHKNVEIKKAIDSLIEKYRSDDFSFEIVEIASGYKFLTKGSFHNTVGTLIKKNNQKRLSKAALETLSIIAYKQPVTKSDVEGIRGVNCDYTIQKLLEKDLAAIKGRAEGPGRPLLYGTSDKFMDYFGIKDIDSLPKLQDLKVPEIQIGEPAPIEEDRATLANEASVENSESNVDGNQPEENISTDQTVDENQINELVEDESDVKDMPTSEEIDGEKPRKEEEAHQAQINQEIVENESDVKDMPTSEEIDGEKPRVEEEAHQAQINQEIVENESDVKDMPTSEEIDREKPREEEKVHQAQINQEIVEDDRTEETIETNLKVEDIQQAKETDIDIPAIDTPDKEDDSVIDKFEGEKPRDDEAHRALLNQEIVSSVNIEEAKVEEADSINKTIISDEEE